MDLYQDTFTYYGNGSSQRTRTLKALMPEYVQIDDHSLSDLMAFAAKYARLVNHFSADNSISGNWESFFSTDISIILATVVSTNLDGLEQKHQQLVASISQTYQEMEKYGLIRELFEQILGIASQVNTWFRQVNRINISRRGVEDTVARELHNIIERKLRAHLHTLIAYDVGAGDKKALGGPMELDYSAFDGLWEADPEKIEPINIFHGNNLLTKLDAALVQLRLLYRSFFNVLAYLVYHFDRYFEDSLSEKTNHKADISLFIGFLYLFRHAQRDLNHVVSRHLEYYYDTYLLQKRRASIPDQAHVQIQLARHVKEHALPAGTELSAGRSEEGEEIIFTTDRDFVANQIRISHLQSLYLGKFSKVETSRYQLVTGMYAAPVANSKDGNGAAFDGGNIEWPTFGEEQQNRVEESRMMNEAEIGLVVASPMFFLQEGERVVKLHLNFVQESTSIYYKLIQALRKDRNIEAEAAFQIAFPDGETKNLSVLITTENGWFEINPNDLYLRTPEPWSPYRLTIEFTLGVADPAWVGFDPALFEGERAFSSRLPLLKLLLNHNIEPYPYSFLRDLEIDHIEAEVEVDRVRKITAYNELGLLDTTQPFQPFGPLPTVGSYLLLGNAEIFRKPLTDLQIRYEWQNIPATDADFDTHYQDYADDELGKEGIKARDFRIQLSALSHNRFSPGEEDSPIEVPLFASDIDKEEYGEDDRIPLKKCVIKDLNLKKLRLVPEPQLAQLEPFSVDARSGYLRLELTGPEPAFGHQLYQRLFPEVVTHNAQPQHSDNQKNIPQQPYTPLLSSISFSYKAKTRINLANKGEKTIPEQVYHLHPFGLQTIYFRGAPRIHPLHLLPQYREDGYLMIGLSGVEAPQTVSLLFQLTTSKYKGSTRFKVPEVQWSYLVNNQWVAFEKEEVLLDTTYAFTQKGLVQLALPRKISRRNDIMESGTYWIRAAVKGDTEVLCHAIGVEAQVISATFQEFGPDTRLQQSLPASSITKLVRSQSEVQAVRQPFPSFNGKAREEDEEYFGRVSERLRTKGRGITHWDLERLTLGKFHTLKQIKCLSHLSHPEIPSLSLEQGVTMVVVPSRNDSLDHRMPKVNYKTLSDIEQYLSQTISPFAKVKVRNPVYEYIRVYADIKFTEGNNNGQTMKRLGRDLQDFLCPWMKDPRQDLQIGGIISEDEILNFVKALPYVVFVTRFSLLQISRLEDTGRYLLRDTATETDRISELQAQPWGVLVPDDDHEFTLIEKEIEAEPKEIPSPIHFQGMYDITRESEHIVIKARRKPKVIGKANSKKTHTLSIQL